MQSNKISDTRKKDEKMCIGGAHHHHPKLVPGGVLKRPAPRISSLFSVENDVKILFRHPFPSKDAPPPSETMVDVGDETTVTIQWRCLLLEGWLSGNFSGGGCSEGPVL